MAGMAHAIGVAPGPAAAPAHGGVPAEGLDGLAPLGSHAVSFAALCTTYRLWSLPMTTEFAHPETERREWYVVDASG